MIRRRGEAGTIRSEEAHRYGRDIAVLYDSDVVYRPARQEADDYYPSDPINNTDGARWKP
jgi:hypothetical protein